MKMYHKAYPEGLAPNNCQNETDGYYQHISCTNGLWGIKDKQEITHG